MLVEEVVKIFIRIIDTKLFKAILPEVLETKDVEDGDGVLDRAAGRLTADDLIEPGHQPGEQGAVQRLGDRVTGIQRLVNVERDVDGLALDVGGLVGHGVDDSVDVELE